MAAPEIAFASRSIEDLSIPHQVSVNPLTGSADIQVLLPLTPGRAGFGPSLSLHYSSSAGNSVYGVGWSLGGLPAIMINTKEGLPNYDGQDRYVFNGSDELVPVLEQRGNSWDPIVESRGDYWVYYFRSKIERSHTQFEQWVHKENRRMHWLTRGRDDTVSVYGQRSDNHGRIADPDDPSRTYLWLIEAQYDQQGNAISYEYLPENMQGVDMRSSFEHDRTPHATHLAQRYLKRIRYGNTQPLRADTPMPDDNEWSFEVVLDYGDHGDERFPTATPSRPWTARVDAYSIYRPGFEIRTYRLCRHVLMFHRFQEHGLNPALIGATSFEYHEASAGSTLQAIHYTGYRRDEALGTLSHRELPPLRFQYTSPNVGQSFNPIPEETRENLPRGLGGLGYRWIDLYGEGLPGILTETSQAWYYKPNHGEGVFGAQAAVIEKPSMLPGTYMLSDFDQDGNTNLVVVQGRQAGYYEFDRDNDGWKNYQPFEAAPQIDLMGAKVQWLDLNGDGQADILISEQDRYIWYPSKGKEGFGDPIELSKMPRSGQPLQLNENPNLDFFFADINGDGLLDLVKVQNGRVEYWPQIGNGRFGDGILMEDAPILDFESEFDASRLRFADLDGSGTADLLYIGRGEVRYWINASGNRYVEGGQLTGLPYLDNLASVQILDFLGDGTPCLVWSSSLNGSSNAPVQYLQLTNGIKPRLLLSIDNSMGQETRLTYSLSSRHYLRDRRAGREWLSKLPSHTIVVDRKEIVDLIGNASFVSRYEYHDGYFDSEERIFRGFGQVDQYDSEVFRNQETAPEHYTAPTCTRTWFHNGAFGWDIRRFAQYYQGDARQGLLPRDHIDNLVQLGAGEFENGIRTLAGMVIRQEIYATDNTGQRAEHPYQVTQSAYRLRRLQPSKDDDDACFMAYQSEQLAYNYEQQPADPRISHQFTLDVDNYGNVSETCAIAYPRRSNILTALPAQRQIHITASRQSYLNIDQSHRRELGIPIESKTFEIGHLQPAEDTLFQFDFLKNVLRPALSSPLSFHDTFSATASRTQARLIGWNQNYYWNDDRSAVLPLRQVGQRTLLHHTEATCFTDELIAETLGDRISPDMLETDGHYHFREGYWWQRSPVTHYLLAEHFNLLARIEHLNGGSIAYTYDAPYYLTLIQTQDALANRTRAEIDYHLIAPYRITDANDNVAEVLYDALGMVVVSTEQGSVLGSGGTAERYGNDLQEDYILQADATFNNVLTRPEHYLQTASQFFYYEFASDAPLRSIALAREDLVHDGQGNRAPSSRIQMNVSYADGFGRSLQTKQKVEGGPAIRRDASGRVILSASGTPEEESIIDRWLVSGHVVFNNKQQPVRQYEPFYSSSVAFESDAELQHFGVSALSRYDPAGRLIQTDLPDGTLTRAEFTPWEMRQYDPNDTVQEASSSYRVVRELLLDTDPEKQALRKAQAHADTPTITQLDPLGREIVHIQTSHEGANRTTQSHFDIQGNVTSVIDARGLTAFTYRYDMLGRGLYQLSMDAGEAWSFPDALDQPIHQWNGRGIHRQTRFDLLGRPTQILIEDAAGPRMAERMRYGEDPSVTEAVLKNARGQLVHHHDQAGIQTVHQYAPNGTPLRSERHLLEDYTSEPDWTLPDTVRLDPSMRFETRSVLDALGRVKRQHLPDGTTRWMDYLQSGGLAQIRVSTADGGLNAFPFLKESEFNARGQRVRTVMGNETEIEVAYKYDPVTFRMNQLTSRQISGNRARLYQDISYTYDPAGNIVHHVDRAQQPAGASPQLIAGLNVSSHCDFTYDAFYQLTEATGRVHEALMAHDYRPGLPEPALKHTQHLTLNNGAVVGRYTHSYSYDLAGNIQRIRHQAPTHSWTRTMWISASSNRSLPATDHNDLSVINPESRFDASGNCVYMPHVRAVDWNDRGNISHILIIDRSNQNQPSDREYYVYGSDGMRLRKVHEQLVGPGQLRITEKIYLNGGEIKRIRHNGELILERTTSHISDGVNRIAILHQWSQDRFGNETDDISQKKIHYQLFNHLGSSSLEIGEAGNVISYEEYFPFGGSAFVAGDNRREINLKDYRYSGKERDDATGFYYYGHRYYVPWTGRWLSPDPIGPEDGLNLYQFVQNNPVNLTDPNGLQSSDRNWTRFEPVYDPEIERGYARERRTALATSTPLVWWGQLVLNPADYSIIRQAGRHQFEGSQGALYETHTSIDETNGQRTFFYRRLPSEPQDEAATFYARAVVSRTGPEELNEETEHEIPTDVLPDSNTTTEIAEDTSIPDDQISEIEEIVTDEETLLHIDQSSSGESTTQTSRTADEVLPTTTRPQSIVQELRNEIIALGGDSDAGQFGMGILAGAATVIAEPAYWIIDLSNLLYHAVSDPANFNPEEHQWASDMASYVVSEMAEGNRGDIEIGAELAGGMVIDFPTFGVRHVPAMLDTIFSENATPGERGAATFNLGAILYGTRQGVPRYARRIGLTTGTQRLLAGVEEIGLASNNLRLRAIQIEADILNYEGRGRISDIGAQNLTVAVAEGIDVNTLETTTSVSVNSPQAYSLIRRLGILQPGEVPVPPVRTSGSSISLPANLHHSELPAIRYLLNRGADIGRVATSRPGCSSCQIHIATDSPGFTHINPESFNIFTQSGSFGRHVRWLRSTGQSWFRDAWRIEL